MKWACDCGNTYEDPPNITAKDVYCNKPGCVKFTKREGTIKKRMKVVS